MQGGTSLPIFLEKDGKTLHLQNKKISYVLSIEKDKYVCHRYWGRRLESFNGSTQIQMIDRGFATNPFPEERVFSLNALPLETSTQQSGDHRISNYTIRSHTNQTRTDFIFKKFDIITGKQPLEGLPTLEGEDTNVTTLIITLYDDIQQLEMKLYYHLYEQLPVITRHVAFLNHGEQEVFLDNAGSLQVDIAAATFDLLTLYGSHTNEANISRRKLHNGIQKIESTRGASSPQHQPFLALLNPNTDEFSGEVRAFHLIYSGNFQAQVEVEQYGSSRVQLGINAEGFSWKLSPGGSFDTPEAVMVYSNHGLNEMSHTFHTLYQQYLCPKSFRNQERPIVLNTWEANYFDISEEKSWKLAETAAQIGIEMFVLDDGWFGNRNDDTSSLGDWIENKDKLPNGIAGLAEMVKNKGMKFGLWFEPEMTSPNSELFKAHPDWIIHTHGYKPIEGRRQLVLDLSNAEVQDFLISVLSEYLVTGKIDYIKWDMNRHITDIGSTSFPIDQQGEISHRYILGLYRILDTLVNQFPNVLFENCSSGGGRFDPGMMRYMAQTWTSDNTDALCRTKIQYGYSLLYPPIMMGAHVSSVPNHQVGRITSLETRGRVAMSGNLGYELDLTEAEEEELLEIENQISFYKQQRKLFQFGKFYRLKAPGEYFESAWMFKNEKEAIVVYFNGIARPAVPVNYLPVYYLEDLAIYKDVATGRLYSGSELNYAGVTIPRVKEDYKTLIYHFEKVETQIN
ncbi:alpha-galactosidase [Bacillus circulans]|jgi:alpha-galactosidase|uniref:Alpha-galactosidase n=2 Tax=Niallia circulans TaxID=1397 RepID=A0AA91TVM5_NIACI|nr:alpha-galactosidase [Niallia circulans]PAD84746.1 alpha-galactosidase [Niallia circulans]QJX62435.1 alpha-galactosidase [Niallia circulans]